jgi:hypothetical protein
MVKCHREIPTGYSSPVSSCPSHRCLRLCSNSSNALLRRSSSCPPTGTCPAALTSGALPESAILLHPFSRGTGKSLTPAQTLALCQELAPLPVVLVGRSDVALPALPANTQNLLNQTTLPELIWLIRRSRGVISVDSGPMHIAAALTPHVLSIHTWSDPRKVGPWHPGTTVWKAGRLMPTGQFDPALCALPSDFPDSAIPTVAAWAHGLPSAGMFRS